MTVDLRGQATGQGDRPRQIPAHCLGPAIVAPAHRIEQGLATKRPETVLIAMIDHPPLPAWAFEQRRMAT
jgi:hypothetical protein